MDKGNTCVPGGGDGVAEVCESYTSTCRSCLLEYTCGEIAGGICDDVCGGGGLEPPQNCEGDACPQPCDGAQCPGQCEGDVCTCEGECEPGEPIEFEDGIYVIVATVRDPLPINLRLITELEVADSGLMAMVGTEANPIGDASSTTNNPDELEVDSTSHGFVVHMTGQVSESEEREREFETDPKDLVIKAGVHITLSGASLSGQVLKNADGEDVLQGNLHWEELQIDTGSNVLDYEGGDTPIIGVQIRHEQVNGDMARLCGDLCGSVPDCTFPPDFPPAPVCRD